jgi:hypothetical protein
VADKAWHFAVMQNRPYWRLREFDWCEDLTDYVDIYFWLGSRRQRPGEWRKAGVFPRAREH